MASPASNSARCGGSSRILEQRIGAEPVELVDGIDDGDAPAALARRRAEKRHAAAHVVDRDVLAQDALFVGRAFEDEEVGLGLRRDPGAPPDAPVRRQATLP